MTASSLSNLFGLPEELKTAKGSFTVFQPAKVEVGPHEVFDICFSEDFSILLLKPAHAPGLRTDPTFINTLVKQSKQKLKLIRAMREGRLRKNPPVGSLVLPDITGHIMPAKSHPRLSAIKELRTETLQRTDTLLNLSTPEEPADRALGSVFGLGPLKNSSPIEKQVFINYYESVFGRPHARGDIYKVHAQQPKDLTNMDSRQLKHEYKRLIKKGRENDIIAYAVNEEPNVPKKPPTFKQTNFDISSKNVDKYYSAVKHIDETVAHAKQLSKSLLAKAVEQGAATQVLRSRALRVREKARSLGRLTDLALFGRKADPGLEDSEASESSNLDSDPKQGPRLTSQDESRANASYEVRRSKVLHQRDLSLDCKRETLITISRLKEPLQGPEAEKQFDALLRQAGTAQRGLLLLKLASFLRLLDGLRLARRLV